MQVSANYGERKNNKKQKMKTKKAQIKVQQMAFMLLAITLFFVLVGLFAMVFGFSGLKKSATELEEKNALLLVTKLSNSPEFACGNSFGTGNLNCVDEDKLMSLMKNIEKYENFWGKGVSNIEVRIIYPETEEKLCNLGNYPNCNVIRVISGKVSGYSAENFVSLCRKESLEGETYNKCELAKLMVSYDEVQ